MSRVEPVGLASLSLWRNRFSLEPRLFLAYGEIAAVNNFRDDVNPVHQIEVDKTRLPVFDLVDRGLFLRVTLDVGESIVVVDGGHRKRRALGLLFECVVEMELRGIVFAELGRRSADASLGFLDRLGSLGARGFSFAAVERGF